MDLEDIPGLSPEFNTEVRALNAAFSGTSNYSDEPSASEPNSVVNLDLSVEDEVEEAEVTSFFDGEPCCTTGPNKSACWKQFGREKVLEARRETLELEKNDVDLAILAELRVMRADGPAGRSPIGYQFCGKPICKSAFLFLHAVGSKRMKNLISHYSTAGLSSRTHKNTRKRPHNRTDGDVVEGIKGFIEKFADNHAMPLPGRLPAFKDYRVMLLPSDMSKSAVYRAYSKSCQNDSSSQVSLSTFTSLWNKLCPYIAVMKPATDLCYTCQQNANFLMKAANMPESVKSDKLTEAQAHLSNARSQRLHYNRQCASAKEALEKGPLSEMHYSFDYAQQVHYPFNAQQPGPIFFKTPRKCGIFGVACEAMSTQVNYLIDEADTIGKGANATISLVHHYLHTHGHQVKQLYLHADNCVGQNKNNYMVQYLMWRTLAGINEGIELSFMLVGHTKFAPDRFFGLFKNLYRKSQVDTMVDIERVVEESSTSGKNKAQLTISSTGVRYVHWYNWADFLSEFFKPVPNITKYHHFRVDKTSPGVVYVRVYSHEDEDEVSIFKKGITASSLRGRKPVELTPTGLDAKRQWYLYDEIRPYCSSNLAKDYTCPKPTIPRPETGERSNKRRK